MERTLVYEHDLPVSIEAFTVDLFPTHFHTDMQIIYMLKGEIELRLSYAPYVLKAGDMHFVHRNDIHALKGLTKDNLVLLFNFNVDALSTLYPDFHMQIFTTQVSKKFVTYEKKIRLRDYIFNILNELTDNEPGYKSRIFDIANEMLRILYRDFRGFYIDTEEKIFKHTVSSDPVQIDRISRVVNFVYENYSYKLSLNEIAENEHISKFYLSHLFQKYVGPNFRDFVSMVRVEMSEHHLLNSDMPITRVAQECGFSHPKYYIEHFKNWFGGEPGEYREKFGKTTIDYVNPLIKEIPLAELLNYRDVAPIFEKHSDNSRNTFKSISIAKISSGDKISWRNVLELNVDTQSLGDSLLKSMYLEFYENIIEKGLKNSVSHHVGRDKDIDYINSKPQEAAISRLDNIVSDFNRKRRIKWKADFLDLNDIKNGLVTGQGLKKPVYYLFMFLSELYDEILKIGKNHIISGEEGDIKMILFNKSSEMTVHLDVIPRGLSGAYRLTEQRLTSDTCFLERWKQLDYKADLSPKELRIVNGMSFPKGKFETVPDIAHFAYHCDMEPLEIVQLALIKMDSI